MPCTAKSLRLLGALFSAEASFAKAEKLPDNNDPKHGCDRAGHAKEKV